MAKSLDIIDPKRDEPTPEENNEEAEGDDLKVKESGGGGVFYLVLGIIAVVVATAAALYILYKDKPATDSNQAGVISTLTATQSTTAESLLTATSTTTATSLATSSAGSSTFKYTNQSIRVANGNGISGEGANIKKILEDAGFKVASVGNANKNYDQTVIFYKTGQKNLAEALKSAINSKYTAELTESDSTVGTYDAVIALGAK